MYTKRCARCKPELGAAYVSTLTKEYSVPGAGLLLEQGVKEWSRNTTGAHPTAVACKPRAHRHPEWKQDPHEINSTTVDL